MKGLQFMNAPGLFVEIGPATLKALHEDRGLELPLERLPDGRLAETCKTRVIEGLQKFLQRKSWQPRVRAICAIGARGVSLRRLALPAVSGEEFQRVLLMQIESEFPLRPEDLAWGCEVLGETRQSGNARQDVLVVAVKREVVNEYSELLSRCGASPVFTLAALARSRACRQSRPTAAMLDVGRTTSELMWLENGVPAAVRTLPWGDVQLKEREDALDALAKSINGKSATGKLLITGSVDAADLAANLARRLGGVDCEALKVAAGEGRSAAILGLKQAVEENGGGLLLLQSRPVNGKAGLARPAPLKLAAVAVALALGLLLLPYTESILLKPVLARRLAALQSATNRLDTIDREWNFLQYLKQSQPPYLDALYLFAKFAPQGSRMDSLSMNRRGEVSLRGSMRSGDQVSEFRAKLIQSGFFHSVSVEEQAPTPDRQKVNVRMTAQWRPLNERSTLAIGPTAEEIAKAKDRKDLPGAGGMPPGAMPMGMPVGMPMGMPEGMPSGAGPARIRTSAPPPGAMPAALPPGVHIQLPPGAELPPGFTPGAPPPQRQGNP